MWAAVSKPLRLSQRCFQTEEKVYVDLNTILCLHLHIFLNVLQHKILILVSCLWLCVFCVASRHLLANPFALFFLFSFHFVTMFSSHSALILIFMLLSITVRSFFISSPFRSREKKSFLQGYDCKREFVLHRPTCINEGVL